jgi:hypothetical protein
MNCLLLTRTKRLTFKRAYRNMKLTRLLICDYCSSLVLNNKSSGDYYEARGESIKASFKKKIKNYFSPELTSSVIATTIAVDENTGEF